MSNEFLAMSIPTKADMVFSSVEKKIITALCLTLLMRAHVNDGQLDTVRTCRVSVEGRSAIYYASSRLKELIGFLVLPR